MFNLGFSELIIIGVIALVFIGPKQLPEVARVIGRLINEWKRATSEFSSTFKDNEAFKDWERRKNEYLSQLETSVQSPAETDKKDDPPKEPLMPHGDEGPAPVASTDVASEQMELHLEEDSSGEDKK